MILKHDRFKTNTNGTLATLNVFDDSVKVGSFFVCEDPKQTRKIAGETRIGAGKFKVTLRKEGGMLQRYKKRLNFPHPGMLWIRNVIGFTFCYYHIGNTKKDTDGCPLIGMTCNRAQMTVRRSKEAYTKFYALVIEAAQNGTLETHITDEPAESAV